MLAPYKRIMLAQKMKAAIQVTVPPVTARRISGMAPISAKTMAMPWVMALPGSRIEKVCKVVESKGRCVVETVSIA